MVDFIFIGPSKTASTWIYKALDESNEFSLPTSKDIYYFDKFYAKGIEWYHSQFPKTVEGKLIGEFSHDYIYNVEAIKRIKAYNPAAKLILCARNPYERSESGIKFLQRNGYGFKKLDELIIDHHELVDGSLYGKNYSSILEEFPASQVLILDYLQLQNDPQEFLNSITEFLNVKNFVPSILETKINPAQNARNRYLALFVKKVALTARKVGFGSLVGMLKMNPTINRLLYKKSGDSFQLSNEDKKLLESYFKADIDLFNKLTDNRFAWWTNAK